MALTSPSASWSHLRVLASPWTSCVLSPSRAQRTMSSVAVLARSTISGVSPYPPVDAGQLEGGPCASRSSHQSCAPLLLDDAAYYDQDCLPVSIAGSPVDTPCSRLAAQALTTSVCSTARLSHHCSTPFSRTSLDGPSCPQRPSRDESLPMQSLFCVCSHTVCNKA